MVTVWLVLGGLAAMAGLLIWWGVSRGKPGGPREHPKGRPLPTRDGLWVASKGEQRIANWLSARGLAYAYEPEVAGGLTPDFHLEGTDVVIEYWGLASQPAYEARMLEKIETYREHGYTVVSVFPGQLRDLEAILEDELRDAGVL